jgi:cytochrome c peroxidase
MGRSVAMLFVFVSASCALDQPETETTSTTSSAVTVGNQHNYPNDEGIARTFNTSGPTDLDGIFQRDFGTNERTCGTCHDPADGWTISQTDIAARFDASEGTDPLFRTNDGSVSPNADVSTEAARLVAYNMLVTFGDIRVGRPIPDGAEFELLAVDDPYNYASAAELSLFRRPLPSMNLKFITAVMWDNRESVANTVAADLAHQANDATLGHAEAAQPLTANQQTKIVAFETPLFAAQYVSNDAGPLTGNGGNGGPEYVADNVSFYPGISRPGHTFDLYDAWADLHGTDAQSLARQSVARGQVLFNTNQFLISGAAGIPDQRGSCSTCHNTPDVGGHSSPFFVNIGIADASRRTPDLPLYTLRNLKTYQTVQTTDPGLALTTGKWADIGRFKVPNLRGVETRSPYFHNGHIGSIEDLVAFYNTRFAIGLTDAQQADLVAFVKVL